MVPVPHKSFRLMSLGDAAAAAAALCSLLGSLLLQWLQAAVASLPHFFGFYLLPRLPSAGDL